MIYNWQQKDWPDFVADGSVVEDDLFTFAERIGSLSGMVESLSDASRTDVLLAAVVAEAVKSSEIEGEFISREDVMSSIRNQLGLNTRPEIVKDARATGMSELMLAIRDGIRKPLTQEALFEWHIMLMKGNRRVNGGLWRTGKDPMQVVSRAAGREKIHFEAPPSSSVTAEMRKFIKWFNRTTPAKPDIREAPIRAAMAHLYFESIHPFEDGNGRIGRAISEKALSQGIGYPLMFSISQTIEANKKLYYRSLETAQQSNEITAWIRYFMDVLLAALEDGTSMARFVIKKARFFDKHESQLNARQLKVVHKMLERGPGEFEGGMNARKYISITRTSKATATRDLQDLVAKEIIIPFGGGRSRSYQVNI